MKRATKAIRAASRLLVLVAILATVLVYSPVEVFAHLALPAPASIEDEVTPLRGQWRDLITWAESLGAPEEFLEDMRGRTAAEKIEIRGTYPWGDLTGDGLSDVLLVDLDVLWLETSSSGTLRIEALEGKTGRSLWTRNDALVDGWAFPVEARLGPQGEHGVLIMESDRAGSTWIGLSGRGEEIFKTTVWGSGGLLEGGEPLRSGIFRSAKPLDALPGKATDFLLAYGDRTYLPSPPGAEPAFVGTTRVALFDGRDGSITDLEGTDIAINTDPVPWPAPDLDGDKNDDYVVLPVAADPQEWDDEDGELAIPPDLDSSFIRGRSSGSGSALWLSDKLVFGKDRPFDRESVYPEVGDLDRDRLPDLIVTSELNDFATPQEKLSEGVIYAISGKSGFLLWEAPGQHPEVMGDVDGDRRTDFLVNVPSKKGQKYERFLSYSGTGRKMLDKRFPARKRKGYAGGSVQVSGDFQPDGIPEIRVHQAWVKGEAETLGVDYKSTLLSASTGRPLRVQPGALWPLTASFDGGGDDFYEIQQEGDLFEVRLVDGTSKDLLVEAVLAPPPGVSFSDYYLGFDLVRLDADRCTDLLMTIEDLKNESYAFAFDGGSGKALWGKPRDGIKLRLGPTVTSRRDENEAC